MTKALALLSGGLDSTLAIRVMQEQGIEVTALNFVTMFCNCTSRGSCKLEARKMSEYLGIEVKVVNSTREFLEIVKNPKHGYGKNLNPCIDCRIHMFKEAGRLMKESGASFIITGEVLGQRPMSQHKAAMSLIDRRSGLTGYVLRPLCARHLEPTVPETTGLVDREKLLAIRGRSRKPQMELAEVFGLRDYPCPAGGCLLTDPQFAHRMRDALEHGDPTVNDVHLLKIGRHFRLDDRTKAIVGRDESDNTKIETFARAGDKLLDCTDVPGPTTLLRGDPTEANVQTAAGLTVRYGKREGANGTEVTVRSPSSEDGNWTVWAAAIDSVALDQLMITRR